MAGIPTEWTFGGEIDWSSSDSVRMRDFEYLFKPIFESIKERDAAVGRSVPSLIAADYNPLRPVYDYADAVQSEVTALIPYFVNFLLPAGSPGNYDGETNIPTFTESTMLTECDIATRIVPTRMEVFPAWFRQQYQMLNLMRWTKQNSVSISIYGKRISCVRYRREGIDGYNLNDFILWGPDASPSSIPNNWYYSETLAYDNLYMGDPPNGDPLLYDPLFPQCAELVTEYTESGLTSISESYADYYYEDWTLGSMHYISGELVQIGLCRSVATISPTYTIPCTIDAYIKNTVSGVSENGIEFDLNTSFNFEDGKFMLIGSGLSIASGGSLDISLTDYTDIVSVTPPAAINQDPWGADSSYANSTKSISVGLKHAILKFNFTFKDW